VKTGFLLLLLELGSPLVSGVNEHLSIKSAGLSIKSAAFIPKQPLSKLFWADGF
jgi:hypothetical protein